MFRGELSLSGAPQIGRKAMLSLELTCLDGDSSNIVIVFRLPRGMTPLSQTVFENQPLRQGAPRYYSTEIEIEKAGVYTLQASVYYTTQAGKNDSQHFYTFLSVTESQSQIGDVPFPNPPKHLLKSQRMDKAVLKATQKATGGAVNLRGQIQYFDDNHRVEMPIRRLKVRLFERNVFLADTEIDSTFTDQQ